MSRILTIVSINLAAVLFLMSCSIVAAEKDSPPTAQQASQGTFRCEEKNADQGEVRVGKPIEHTFRFLNTSSKTRHILKVLPGCGCTKVVAYSKDVAPQARGEVKVAFNITAWPGLRRSSVLVETDDPKEPRQTVTVSCQVLPAIELKPVSLYFTPAGSSFGFASRTIEVVGLYPDEKISVGNAQANDPMISVTKETVEEHKRFRLHVAVNKDVAAGTTFANILVPIEGSAQKNTRLSVVIANEAKVKAEPSVLALPVDPNALQSPEFVVKAMDDKPLEVTKAEMANKELQIVLRRIADNTVAVQLKDIKMTCCMNFKPVVVSTNHGQLRVPTTVRSCAVKTSPTSKNVGTAGAPKT